MATTKTSPYVFKLNRVDASTGANLGFIYMNANCIAEVFSQPAVPGNNVAYTEVRCVGLPVGFWVSESADSIAAALGSVVTV